MKWFRICSAVIAVLSLSATTQAGLFDHHAGCEDGKCCDCDTGCEPECCKPTITRPCTHNVYTYQRRCADVKPPCCDDGCDPGCCAPADACCEDECCETDGCGPAACCETDCCDTGCAPKKCSLFGGLFKSKGCGSSCDGDCCDTCCADPCAIAKLIYESQTACYADDRADAIEDLGNDFSCVCNPRS